MKHGIGQDPPRELRFEVELDDLKNPVSPAFSPATAGRSPTALFSALIVRGAARRKTAHIARGGRANKSATDSIEIEPE
jgi:hypothetical protein